LFIYYAIPGTDIDIRFRIVSEVRLFSMPHKNVKKPPRYLNLDRSESYKKNLKTATVAATAIEVPDNNERSFFVLL
jgi:hypothetical protein